jgi:hypothetical protein
MTTTLSCRSTRSSSDIFLRVKTVKKFMSQWWLVPGGQGSSPCQGTALWDVSTEWCHSTPSHLYHIKWSCVLCDCCDRHTRSVAHFSKMAFWRYFTASLWTLMHWWWWLMGAWDETLPILNVILWHAYLVRLDCIGRPFPRGQISNVKFIGARPTLKGFFRDASTCIIGLNNSCGLVKARRAHRKENSLRYRTRRAWPKRWYLGDTRIVGKGKG